MQYKRESFCGPSGTGLISLTLSRLIAWSLLKLDVNLEKPCSSHDIDWDDGPNTTDDIRFALSVYSQVKKQKNPLLAGLMASSGFVLVRLTAIVYKLTPNEV
jgi:hypothetical protein